MVSLALAFAIFLRSVSSDPFYSNTYTCEFYMCSANPLEQRNIIIVPSINMTHFALPQGGIDKGNQLARKIWDQCRETHEDQRQEFVEEVKDNWPRCVRGKMYRWSSQNCPVPCREYAALGRKLGRSNDWDLAGEHRGNQSPSRGVLVIDLGRTIT